jgi:hypothetical protein
LNLVEILQGTNVALKLLSARILTLLALLLTFALFCWAMCTQTRLTAMIAAFWGLMIFLPILVVGRGGSDVTAQRSDSPQDGPGVREPEA